MNVEIIGTQFINKGAELMLLTIIEQLKQSFDTNVNVCMLSDKKLSNPHKLLSYGINKKLPHIKKGINIKWIGVCIPKILRDYCNVIIDQEIHVVLDASGFAYSDQWGENAARNLAASVEGWKKQGAKVILLPQAFGPFTSVKIIKHMRKIIDYADLIYARDDVSYKHLLDICLNKAHNIRLAPDFTNLLTFNKISNFNYSNSICITPNQRMLDKSTNGSKYLKILSNIINSLEESNQDYFFLIHEGHHDRKIINKLLLNTEPKIYQTDDVVEIKKVLGCVKGLIGSRYHGLVSALSQGVPSIAIGWSHKYIELLKDYDCKENFIDLNNDIDINETISLFFDENKYQNTQSKLFLNSKKLKDQSEMMWEEVKNNISDSIETE